DLRENLFDPFITSKPKGSGLGLPLVAKLINDHGGIVEFESTPRRTVFKVMLPIVRSRPAPDWAAPASTTGNATR
ncbi:ATP-binding protein, partial [Novispirillum itersonii]